MREFMYMVSSMYRLNEMFGSHISPKFVLNPNPQYNGIWRWGLWGAMRSGGQSPQAQDQCPSKGLKRSECSQSAMEDTQEDSHVWARELALAAGHQICQCFGLRLLASRTVRSKCRVKATGSVVFCHTSVNSPRQHT